MKVRVTRSVVPNLLTLANLFSGFVAIIAASQGEYDKAVLYIIMGAVFDLLDGLVARLIHAASELGVQLDSLSDAVTFGIAPSFLLYQAYFNQFGNLGLFVSALPAIAGVYRLARFNVQLTSLEDKKYFTGMPIPSGALTIISFVQFYLRTNFFTKEATVFVSFILVILIALAMVSRIKFPNLPRPGKTLKSNLALIFVVILVFVSIFSKGMLIFPIMISYFCLFSLTHFVNYIKTYNVLEEDEE